MNNEDSRFHITAKIDNDTVINLTTSSFIALGQYLDNPDKVETFGTMGGIMSNKHADAAIVKLVKGILYNNAFADTPLPDKLTIICHAFAAIEAEVIRNWHKGAVNDAVKEPFSPHDGAVVFTIRDCKKKDISEQRFDFALILCLDEEDNDGIAARYHQLHSHDNPPMMEIAAALLVEHLVRSFYQKDDTGYSYLIISNFLMHNKEMLLLEVINEHETGVVSPNYRQHSIEGENEHE